MFIRFLGSKGTWKEVLNSARTTVNKAEGKREPSPRWKKQVLLCEHSPIRQLIFKAKWYELKSWISVHLVRHWVGILHFVRTQRSDRTGIARDDLPQSNFVEHEIEVNAQAIINISRRRLCTGCAAPETVVTWTAFLSSIKDFEPELVSVCVPECVYRGWCFEFNSCGYFKTEKYQQILLKYRENINN